MTSTPITRGQRRSALRSNRRRTTSPMDAPIRRATLMAIPGSSRRRRSKRYHALFRQECLVAAGIAEAMDFRAVELGQVGQRQHVLSRTLADHCALAQQAGAVGGAHGVVGI